jgi:hypothetical protein
MLPMQPRSNEIGVGRIWSGGAGRGVRDVRLDLRVADLLQQEPGIADRERIVPDQHVLIFRGPLVTLISCLRTKSLHVGDLEGKISPVEYVPFQVPV